MSHFAGTVLHLSGRFFHLLFAMIRIEIRQGRFESYLLHNFSPSPNLGVFW